MNTLYYAVTVSNHARRERGTALMWSQAFDGINAAERHGRAELDAGNATLAFVVRVADGKKEIVPNATKPASAAKVVRHYLDLLAALDQ